MLLVDGKPVCGMTGPAGLALDTVLELGIVTGGTGGLIRGYLQILIRAVTLETLDLVQPVTRVVPLLINVRRNILVAGRAWSKLLLFSQLRMLSSRPGSRGILMSGTCAASKQES